MTLTIQDLEIGTWLDEWPLPPRPKFMKSQASRILTREVERYTRGELRGRSFLIAGHRGAGKTTLALRAADDVGRQIISDLHDPVPPGPDVARRDGPQRPLVVKLHGPSLLTRELPGPGKESNRDQQTPEQKTGQEKPERGKPAQKTTRKKKSKQESNNPAEAEKTGADTKPTPAGDEAQAALVQITIALYRALAGEVARTFAIHAREEFRAKPGGDQLELAGQLTIELDRAPDAALLRTFWSHLGRLAPGVLWPRKVGATMPDQGIREIVAIATAAQAYQVCSGAVTYKHTEKQTGLREAALESKAEFDLKKLATAIFGLFAGALVGIGALYTNHGFATAVASGIATGLLSSLTLNWSGKRSRRSERTLDYTFIIDRSLQTLDRDLPLVIERIREAGLAPVFIIDELDKLQTAEESIGQLIMRLKHLVADYGFFCFLTDRDYYEHILNKLQTEAYPREHTYFGHALLVQYQPNDLLDYMKQVLLSPAVSDGREEEAGQLDARVLARFAFQRAKLNNIDVMRELARHFDQNGSLLPNHAGLRGRLSYQLRLTIQLAIEHLLMSPALRERVDSDARFAQMAVDTLYAPSRAWEGESTKFAIQNSTDQSNVAGAQPPPQGPTFEFDRKKLLDYLCERMRAQESGTHARVKSDDLDLLLEQLRNLMILLSDLPPLRQRLAADPTLDKLGRKLVDDMPWTTVGKFVDKIPGRKDAYRFLFDVFGRKFDQVEILAPGNALPDDIRDEITASATFIATFDDMMQTLGVQVTDLVAMEILPATITWSRVKEAKFRLQDAAATSQTYPQLLEDLSSVRILVNSVIERAEGMAIILRLAMRIEREAAEETPVPLAAALSAMARYVDYRNVVLLGSAPTAKARNLLEQYLILPYDWSAPVPVPDLQTGLTAWKDALLADRAAVQGCPPAAISREDIANIWDQWAERLAKYLDGETSPVAAVRYNEILLAARGAWPSALLRRDLNKLSIGDWSTLSQQAFASGTDTTEAVAPGWAFLPALGALGFGRFALLFADEELRCWQPATPLPSALKRVVQRGPAAGPSGPPGILLIVREGKSLAETTDYRPRMPVLAVRASAVRESSKLLQWLSSRFLIRLVIEEAEPDGSQRTPVELPTELAGLPRISVTTTPASTREQSMQEDVIWGVKSLDDALLTATRRLGAKLGMAPSHTIRNVSDKRVALVVANFERAGAIVNKKKERGGTWAVTVHTDYP